MTASKRPAPRGKPANPNPTNLLTTNSHHAADAYQYIAGLKRRRDAAYRQPPLECGCRDPWTHNWCSGRLKLTEESYRAAAHHLGKHGLRPAPRMAVA